MKVEFDSARLSVVSLYLSSGVRTGVVTRKDLNTLFLDLMTFQRTSEVVPMRARIFSYSSSALICFQNARAPAMRVLSSQSAIMWR
jgi:hypothetical protein